LGIKGSDISGCIPGPTTPGGLIRLGCGRRFSISRGAEIPEVVGGPLEWIVGSPAYQEAQTIAIPPNWAAPKVHEALYHPLMNKPAG